MQPRDMASKCVCEQDTLWRRNPTFLGIWRRRIHDPEKKTLITLLHFLLLNQSNFLITSCEDLLLRILEHMLGIRMTNLQLVGFNRKENSISYTSFNAAVQMNKPN